MKSAKENKQRARHAWNTDKLLWSLCVLLLAFSAVSLWNAYRLNRTANELLRSATAVPPTIVWYEEVETPETNILPEATASASAQPTVAQTAETAYVLNTNSKKIHSPTCRYAASMQETNKQVVTDKTLEELLNEGYSICSVCNAE
ncbi:MAG: hypothetical protein ACI4LB_05165 [Candidatus Fimenecus sp.]